MSETSPESSLSLTILEHINELRIRLTWAVVSLAIGTVISFLFAPRILTFIAQFNQGPLQTLEPTEGIETFFKVALLSGAILTMPLILYQLWLFISPGLEPKERRYVFVFIPAATLLFLTGIAFAWYILLPTALSFLGSFLSELFVAEWTSQAYVSFVTTFLFWIGLSFQMPLVVYVIARMGLVLPATLREQWRLAIVIIAVMAAIITPSIDPVTMLLTMAPLTVLYILSIGLAHLGHRRFVKQHAT